MLTIQKKYMTNLNFADKGFVQTKMDLANVVELLLVVEERGL